jgi:subtilase family serine protease
MTHLWFTLLLGMLAQPEQTKPIIKPDLKVELVQGGTCYTISKFRIKNVGNRRAAPSTAQIRADGKLLQSIKIGEIDPGETSATYTVAPAAVDAITERPWSVIAIADAFEVLDEWNEVNNQQGIAACLP